MPRTRPPYSPGFRSQMVDLVRAGRSPEDLAREFEPTAQSIAASAVVADKQEGRREEVVAGLSATERDELARLRRENKQLRVERDILSKAAAWFARETGAVPSAMRVPAPLHGDTACDLGSADAFEREAERGAFIHGRDHRHFDVEPLPVRMTALSCLA